MISNTNLFYQTAKKFQDRRKEIEDCYEKNLNNLERFKGSKGYDEDLKNLNKKHDADLQTLREEYRPELMTILGGMTDAIGRRSVKAPTTDQVNLLNILRMKKKVTLEECQRTAEAVKDNPIAVRVVTEIAHEHNIMRNFDDLCSEMSSETASDIVTGMKNTLDDYLQYDTTFASRRAKEYYSDLYGQTESTLRKRTLFEDKEGCFRELWGLDGKNLSLFTDIVDERGKTE